MVNTDFAHARVYARRPFVYDGKQIFREQVFRLANARNDEKLVRLRYVVPLSELGKDPELLICAECGREFISMGAREGHGDQAHRPQRPLNPYEEDERAEREEAFLNEVAPLALEKSLASQKA